MVPLYLTSLSSLANSCSYPSSFFSFLPLATNQLSRGRGNYLWRGRWLLFCEKLYARNSSLHQYAYLLNILWYSTWQILLLSRHVTYTHEILYTPLNNVDTGCSCYLFKCHWKQLAYQTSSAPWHFAEHALSHRITRGKCQHQVPDGGGGRDASCKGRSTN